MGTDKRERQKANRQIRLEELQRQERKQRTRKRVITWTLLIVLGGGALYAISLLVGRSNNSTSSTTSTTADISATSVAPTTVFQPSTVPGATLSGTTPCPAADGSSARTITFAQAPPTCIDPAKTYTATVTTNKGEFTMDLDAKKAPLAVNNLVVLSRYHFYDGVLCHRIIESFVVQCGDPTGTGTGGPGYTFADELPQAGEYKPGSLAMANSGPDTNGSQFFIITGADGAALGPKYSLFGQVGQGLDTTVKTMEAAAGPPAPADGSSAGGIPTKEPIYIESVTITES